MHSTKTQGATMTGDTIVEFATRHIKAIAVAIVALVILIIGYNTWSSTWTEGVRYETRLSAQYLDNQNYLSTYISGFYEQTGIAEAQTTALNTVLSDAVKGRYESTSAGGGGYTVNSPFFNAIVEAYPENSTQELIRNWGKIQDYISSGRESYRNQQSKLLDQLRTYDTWRNSGVAKRFIISIIGMPSENLKARVGENLWEGDAALDKMYQIVLTSNTLDAYNDGVLEPLQP